MTVKTLLKGLDFYVIRSHDGKYHNSDQYGWVETLDEAKVYKRVGDARCAISNHMAPFKHGLTTWKDRNKDVDPSLIPEHSRNGYIRYYTAEIIDLNSLLKKGG